MLNYCSSNIIGQIVHKLCSAFAQCRRLVDDRALSTNFITYLWYSHKTRFYEQLRREDGLSHLHQRQYLALSVRPVRAGGPGIDKTASERTNALCNAMCNNDYAFLLKRKHILCDNTVYTLDDAAFVNFLPSRALYCEAHVRSLHLLFSKLDPAVMSTLKIQKHVPPPSEVVNI